MIEKQPENFYDTRIVGDQTKFWEKRRDAVEVSVIISRLLSKWSVINASPGV